jgi:hypothetical protein
MTAPMLAVEGGARADRSTNLGRLRELERRWPFAPVRRLGTRRQLARRLGVDDAQITRWNRTGLEDRTADRVGVALGMHPLELWPDWLAGAGANHPVFLGPEAA